MAFLMTMFAMANGVRDARVEDYLPPWQQPAPREMTEDEVFAAFDRFDRMTKK